MNRLSVVIAMSVLGLSSSALAADEEHGRNTALSNLDNDGDGYINIEEFQQRGAENLRRLDSDDNGVLTLDEFLNAGPRRGPGARNRGDDNANRAQREPSEEQIARMQERRTQMTERATARFQEMDANGDDAVSLTEFQEANFLSLDSDNNGLLSAEELRPKRPERRRPGGERSGKRGGKPRGA